MTQLNLQQIKHLMEKDPELYRFMRELGSVATTASSTAATGVTAATVSDMIAAAIAGLPNSEDEARKLQVRLDMGAF